MPNANCEVHYSISTFIRHKTASGTAKRCMHLSDMRSLHSNICKSDLCKNAPSPATYHTLRSSLSHSGHYILLGYLTWICQEFVISSGVMWFFQCRKRPPVSIRTSNRLESDIQTPSLLHNKQLGRDLDLQPFKAFQPAKHEMPFSQRSDFCLIYPTSYSHSVHNSVRLPSSRVGLSQ